MVTTLNFSTSNIFQFEHVIEASKIEIPYQDQKGSKPKSPGRLHVRNQGTTQSDESVPIDRNVRIKRRAHMYGPAIEPRRWGAAEEPEGSVGIGGGTYGQ